MNIDWVSIFKGVGVGVATVAVGIALGLVLERLFRRRRRAKDFFTSLSEAMMPKEPEPLKWYLVCFEKDGLFSSGVVVEAENRVAASMQTSGMENRARDEHFTQSLEIPEDKVPAEEFRKVRLTPRQIVEVWPEVNL